MSESPVESKARAVREASGVLYDSSTAAKNRLLRAIMSRLRSRTPAVLAANRDDVEHARRGGLSSVLLDRLKLDEEGIRRIVINSAYPLYEVRRGDLWYQLETALREVCGM